MVTTNETLELFHGGHERVESIPGQVFFSCDRAVALSHGPVVTRFEIPSERVLFNYSLNYETHDIGVIMSVLQSECATDADLDRAWEIVVESRGCVGAEEELEMFRADDAAEAGWNAQRIRGCVAKALGYRAIEMEDEHGTTWLVVE
jgi:hypothetical protein